MGQKILKTFIVAFSFVMISLSAQAQERGTTQEAQMMAEKATAFLNENGIEKSIAAFHAPGAPWHDRDLYVFVFDKDGMTIAHGAKATLVGRNLTKMRDVDGKLFLKEIVSVADKGWVEYKWQNPISNKVEQKATYVLNTGKYVVGVGAYK